MTICRGHSCFLRFYFMGQSDVRVCCSWMPAGKSKQNTDYAILQKNSFSSTRKIHERKYRGVPFLFFTSLSNFKYSLAWSQKPLRNSAYFLFHQYNLPCSTSLQKSLISFAASCLLPCHTLFHFFLYFQALSLINFKIIESSVNFIFTKRSKSPFDWFPILLSFTEFKPWEK